MGEIRTAVSTGSALHAAEMPEYVGDVTSAVEAAVESALAVTAERLGLRNAQAVEELLRQGDRAATEYFHYNLATEIGRKLGEWDADVQGAYLCDYDATPLDLAFDETRSPLIHLILVVERKTAALGALLAAVDNALVLLYRDLTGRTELAHLLDVQAVDPEEIRNRIGYGAFFSSLHYRPVPLWTR